MNCTDCGCSLALHDVGWCYSKHCRRKDYRQCNHQPKPEEGADQFRQMPDPADRKSVGSRRWGGWTVEDWIAWLERHPDGCLPSGVGRAIVDHLRRG